MAHRGREVVRDGSVKFGVRTHSPQIEPKLTVRSADSSEIDANWRELASIQGEVRQPFGRSLHYGYIHVEQKICLS